MTTTINASTSSGIVATADGSGIIKVQSNGVTTNALAWVNFAGASGTRNSNYNVSSVTRSATGVYAVAFTTALSDANYAVSFGITGASATGTSTNRNCLLTFRDLATSGFNLVCTDPTSGTASDSALIGVTVFGN